MMKRVIFLLVVMVLLSGAVYGIEFGVIGGSLSKTQGPGFTYGLSGSSGLFVPMLKIEAEIYKIYIGDSETVADPEVELLAKKSGMSLGIKFRPKFGKIAPYAVAGVGYEFDKFGFSFSKYNKYSFVGGGIHFYLAGMISLRGDLRFQNYSGVTKTRISGGIFFHL